MEQNRCRRITLDTIAEASRTLGENYSLNQEKYEKVEKACDLLEEVLNGSARDGSCKSVSVYGNLSECELVFDMICDRSVLKQGSLQPFRFVKMVDFARFSTVGGDDLRIECFITKLWRPQEQA